MATARLDLRLDANIKNKIEKASALSGSKSLTEYIIKVLEENSTQVITKHESMTLKNDIFDRFVDACTNAKRPNKALRDAVNYTKKQGF